jgi:hypothetical protein
MILWESFEDALKEHRVAAQKKINANLPQHPKLPPQFHRYTASTVSTMDVVA